MERELYQTDTLELIAQYNELQHAIGFVASQSATELLRSIANELKFRGVEHGEA